EFYFYIYSLLGDPAMEIWTAPPRPLVVETPSAIPAGSSSLEIRVFAEDGTTPVPDARVGVTRGGQLVGAAFTDADGFASVLAPIPPGETALRVTVTGTGLLPRRTEIAVESTPILALDAIELVDDGTVGSVGNGDGIPNPGETIALRVGLRNQGPDMIAAAAATLEALWGAEVIGAQTSYPGVQAGDRTDPESPFLIRIAETAEDGMTPRFRLRVVEDGTESTAGFQIDVVAPALVRRAHTLAGDAVLDPGETTDLTVALENGGRRTASDLQAVLRSETPALASVIEATASYGTIDVGESAEPATSFRIRAADDAPIGQGAVFTLTTTTGEGYVAQISFTVPIGSVDYRAPLGPDAYGYWAYDSADTDYPDGAPLYDWISCSTAYGGSGTRLDLHDNTEVVVDLPFPFVYYGKSYDALLVADNGWASFDLTDDFDYYNWSIPNTYGNGALLAPFWDNLDPDKKHDGVLVGDGIYVWNDADQHRFVVEWSRLGNLFSQHDDEDRQDYDDLQTFELVLFDPVYYPTPTGDGIIRFQYKQVVNNDTERMFATVGIENETEDIGLEYSYANAYAAAAAPLSAGLAIEFSTIPARYQPFHLLDVTARREGGGVRLLWEPCDARPRGGYRIYRSADSEARRPVVGRVPGTATTFLDVSVDAADRYRYWIGSTDPVGYETVFGPFGSDGGASLPRELALRAGPPNPSVTFATLEYAVPADGPAKLVIYDATGRAVRTLVDGPVPAGAWTATWNGDDDAGERLPSGIYFARLEAGSQRRTAKLTRIR
ncbi:MAG: T9SS type A sorting domain-containing protein, partial [Candidatus Eisenbacteria bacterium]|nr:T9SS type A sorting domain-containing protein [Candidatus Eisenbacteria bacterium]